MSKNTIMTHIKIDGEVFQVNKKVELLIDRLENDKRMADKQVEIHLKAICNSTRMLNDCKYAVARIFNGRDDMPLWALGEKLRIEWDAEVKHGLTGWIQENWGKLCHISCDCGNLISYDVLRESNQLMCKNCHSMEIVKSP